MNLIGKYAIITGCNRGIGKSIMELFIKNGCNIIACLRKETPEFNNLIKELIELYKIKIFLIYCNLEYEEDVKSAIGQIYGLKIPIDILVNNSGIASGSLFQMTSIKEIQKVMQVNYFSQIQLTQGISKLMIKQNKGTIINITSVAGIIGDAGTLSYGSSKAAMNFATKTIATELGKYNIRVNAIAPSITNTDMLGEMTEEGKNKLIQRSALKRVAEPIEIAETALFLASDNSRYISGQILRVDGGII